MRTRGAARAKFPALVATVMYHGLTQVRLERLIETRLRAGKRAAFSRDLKWVLRHRFCGQGGTHWLIDQLEAPESPLREAFALDTLDRSVWDSADLAQTASQTVQGSDWVALRRVVPRSAILRQVELDFGHDPFVLVHCLAWLGSQADYNCSTMKP
jgi:hypothetical protein